MIVLSVVVSGYDTSLSNDFSFDGTQMKNFEILIKIWVTFKFWVAKKFSLVPFQKVKRTRKKALMKFDERDFFVFDPPTKQ